MELIKQNYASSSSSSSDSEGSPPPSKKFKQLFEEEEEPWQAEELQKGSGRPESPAAEKSPSDYIEMMESSVESMDKFQVIKSRARFLIKDLPEEPEELIAGIVQHCVDTALDEARQRGFEAERLGCTISSELLTSGDVWIPVRDITPNTVDAVLNRFTEVAQSKRQEDINLWGEPFTISVTTVKRTGLPPASTLKGGARQRRCPAVHHRISQKALIKV